MTHQELYKNIAVRTGDDPDTIEKLGFELYTPALVTDRKALKRERRLKFWRQQRRDRHLATIASKFVQS